MSFRNQRLGVAILASTGFDMPHAREMADAALAALRLTGATLAGSNDLLTDGPAVLHAIGGFKGEALDGLVIVQASFTDAAMTVALAQAADAPLVLWAFPEQRTGGRLRLNSFSGINLAGHALGKAGIRFGMLYRDPRARGIDAALTAAIGDAAAGKPGEGPISDTVAPDRAGADRAGARRIAEALADARIGLIGTHPDGLETSAYDAADLAGLTGTQVVPGDLPGLFAAASAVSQGEVDKLRATARAALSGVEALERAPLEKSLRTYAALKAKAAAETIDAYAVRCRPEFFTDHGCAPCGAMAMLGGEGTPCACEADVYGAATLLMLKAVADEPPFIADLVDIDPADDTMVFWRCGLAPVALAAPDREPRATVHPSFQMPLVNEFALKPGPITVARLSQSLGRTRLVLGGGEMLARPRSFAGTSGVARLGRPARDVLATIMQEGLEHHVALAYGDHRAALAGWAEQAGLPIVSLG